MNINDISDFSTLKNSIAEMIEDTLEDVLEECATDSQEHCPKDTGDLRDSFYIKQDGTEIASGEDFTVNVNYGVGTTTTNIEIGYKNEYAEAQENGFGKNGSVFVSYTTPGTGAHFLGNASLNLERNLNLKLTENLNKI